MLDGRRAALAFSVGAASFYVLQRWLKLRREPPTFSVLVWNVLAREFTMYNKEPPGCVQGHQNPLDKLETREQTAARYSLATKSMLARHPDAICLQELSEEFFSEDVNPMAPMLLQQYDVAHRINAVGPGTAVLLRRGGKLVASGNVLSAGASEERTGGYSKSACGVLAKLRDSSTCVWLVSVHLAPYKYMPAAVRTHLELLSDALRSSLTTTDAGTAALPRIVLGGDLNAELHEVVTLQRECSFLGGAMARVHTSSHTGLSANFSTPETIDHAFLSPGLRLLQVELEREPSSPFGIVQDEGPAPVVGASDHVWQHLAVAVE